MYGMGMKRVSLLALGMFGLVSSAHADPVLRVEVSGSCPSEATLRASLSEAVVFSDSDARWSLQIKEGRRRASLRISDSETGSLFVREVRSKDCEALAKAFAVIIHSYFVELQVLPNPLDEEAVLSDPPEPEPSPEPAAEPATPPPSPAPAPAVPPKLGSQLWVGVSLGLLSRELEEGPLAAGIAMGVTRPSGIGASLSVRAHTGSQQRFATEVVERRGAEASASFSYTPDLGPFGIRLALGPGLAMTQVQPKDLPASTAPTRLHPYVAGSSTLLIPLSEHFNWLFILEADGFFLSDQYVIEPYGIVATSPKYSLFASMGIEWNQGPRN